MSNSDSPPVTTAETGEIEKGSYSNDNLAGNDMEKGDLVVVNSYHTGDDDERTAGAGHVKRTLNSRQLQMIGIGGCLGTGIFLTAGESYSTAGPLGLVLAFFIMGVVVYSVMIALGEMSALLPVSGSFTHYATRFVDPALGTTVGWNYWYSDAITVPTEITAAALVISYWDDKTNPAAWISIIMVFVTAINFFGVRWFGEAEFLFAAIKIIAIVGLIILGIVITAGGYPGSDTPGYAGEAIGFRYWRNPGPFLQLTYDHGKVISGATGRFLSFWSVFVVASYTYLGTEIVAMTAAEAINPRRDMPIAIRRVFFRIMLFYVGGMFIISLILSPNDPNLLGAESDGTSSQNGRSSPWVIAISEAGIKGLPSVINAVILIAAFSSGNSMLYAASRTLYGLALDRKAPHFLTKCLKNGVPIWSLTITSLFGPLAYMNCSKTQSSEVFNWFVDLSSIAGIMSWITILVTYARFYTGTKAQHIDRHDFPYRAPFQPWATWFGIIFLSCVVLFSAFQVFLRGNWDHATFITNYLPLPLFFIIFFGWKLYGRTKMVKPEDMDFYTGRRSDAQAAIDNERAHYPDTFLGKVWNWLF